MTKAIDGAPPSVLSERSGLGGDLSRRAMLKGGVTGAAALGLGAVWADHAQATVGGPGVLVQRSDLLTLVNRVSQGYTAAEMTKATTLGYAGYLTQVLKGPTSDPLGDAFLASLQPVISWTPFAAISNYSGDPDDLLQFTQQGTIGLSVLSSKVLLERVMDFWSNALSVYGKKAGNGILRNYSDYYTFRQLDPNLVVPKPKALGSGKRLLTNFARDTSVLYYLDNVISSGPVPNENWAREYLELYTMGQDDPIFSSPNYSEADVQAAAAAFTGWSFDLALTANLGLFKFIPSQHLSGPKTFQQIQLLQDNLSTGEGDQVVSIIVNSLKTGRGIAAKMIRYFLRQDPTPNQVHSASLIYRAGDITSMIGDILSQPNVSALTPSDYLFSSPSRFMYQAMRATGANPDWDGSGPLSELQRMGNAPFEWPAPDGYPDEPEKWAGGIFARWEFANKLFTAPNASGKNPELPGVVFTDTQLSQKVGGATTAPAIVAALDQLLTGGILSVNEKCVLELYYNVVRAMPYNLTHAQALREMFALAISCPSFQYY